MSAAESNFVRHRHSSLRLSIAGFFGLKELFERDEEVDYLLKLIRCRCLFYARLNQFSGIVPNKVGYLFSCAS